MVINQVKNTSFLSRTETLERFFKDIRKYAPLSSEEEKSLIHIYNTGTLEEREVAKTKIINANQRLVVTLAKQYATSENFMDLINEANIGLMEALDKYNEETEVNKNAKFATWAAYFIKRSLNLYLISYGGLVKKNNISKTYHLVSKATNDFVQEFQREPTSEELLEILNEKYNANIKDFKDVTPLRVNSIDEGFGEDDDTNLGDMAVFNTHSSSSNAYERTSEEDYVHNMIESFMNILTPREQQIIKMSYGIGYFREYENCEIAEEVGLTAERVRQMKLSIINRLQSEMKKRLQHL